MFGSDLLRLCPQASHDESATTFKMMAAAIVDDLTDEETVYIVDNHTLFSEEVQCSQKKNVKVSRKEKERQRTKIFGEFSKLGTWQARIVQEHCQYVLNLLDDSEENNAILILNQSFMDTGGKKVTYSSYSMVTTNPEIHAFFLKLNEKYKADKFKAIYDSPKVYLLTKSTAGSFYFSDFKLPSHPFLPVCFSDKNVEFFDKIKKILIDPSPFGRIHIFHGPPGTGKTSYIRSLINDLTTVDLDNDDETEDVATTSTKISKPAKAKKEKLKGDESKKSPEKKRKIREIKFLYVPISSFGFFSSPEAVSSLMDEGFGADSRLVFIIEDADNLIKKRNYDGDDKDSLSNLLNFCDGITGQIFDIEVIVTSNISIDKVDPAFIRPGRLSSLLNFNGLDPDSQKKFFEHFSFEPKKEAKNLLQQDSKTIAQLFEIMVEEKSLVG